MLTKLLILGVFVTVGVFVYLVGLYLLCRCIYPIVSLLRMPADFLYLGYKKLSGQGGFDATTRAEPLYALVSILSWAAVSGLLLTLVWGGMYGRMKVARIAGDTASADLWIPLLFAGATFLPVPCYLYGLTGFDDRSDHDRISINGPFKAGPWLWLNFLYALGAHLTVFLVPGVRALVV